MRPLSCLWYLALYLVVVAGKSNAATTHEKISYHGWPEAFLLKNDQAELVVVPAIGRVMQFKLAGDADGPFWENRALDGKPTQPQSSEWINFGGDKTWPSPQGEWEKMTGRGWPPPTAFDSLPLSVQREGEELVLRSAIDPSYGIETERRISLSADKPEMTIQTTYRKVRGNPVRVGIWIITQLREPERIFMPLPQSTLFPTGYNKQSSTLPAQLRVTNSMVSCVRSAAENCKIGSDASHLIWADDRVVLDIHAEREGTGEFPDNGSSAEIYTNADPNKYVELELLGPLHLMKPGDSTSRQQTYRLFRRDGNLDQQVSKILKDR
ncbi:MAG TPA: DUF4380 domain-containing protein [Verrucomicrobiae bacterium]|nr:DUF4380 domain-containing protein [Verrucomicrobiae bacterium]